MVTTNNFSFGKNLRILTPKEYQQVFDQAKIKVFCQGFLFLAKPNLDTTTRLGFVFGKKNIPLAVTRNKFKRIFREYFRLNTQKSEGFDLVILALKNAKFTKANQLSQQIPSCWQELETQIFSYKTNL